MIGQGLIILVSYYKVFPGYRSSTYWSEPYQKGSQDRMEDLHRVTRDNGDQQVSSLDIADLFADCIERKSRSTRLMILELLRGQRVLSDREESLQLDLLP